MKIFVDAQRCEGHGVCEEVAPELFRIDDEGDLVVLFDGDEVPPDRQEAAAGAVRVCPVNALRAR
ncbi:ferredoxin [Streptomyces sp. RerS4]|uniref:ferredoxin n=1 Tax=Streptomyces sp. RerS4 TaxID=2942449 RepID=UPI00201BC406|nr:ferredoxin [Streptomyces sp. RerS4]UQX03452.1 ferredoxin [Streptomyces sp. RerS4]